MTTGRALAMKLKLMRLAREHHSTSQNCVVPLAPPSNHPLIVEGLASTTDLDLEHVKMRRYAFVWPVDVKGVPLLYKHDAASRAGTVEDLHYDADGNLRIRALVDHPAARRCGAFSVAAKVLDYEIKDADGPNFYAVIKSASLTEISMTDTTANPRALVEHRYAPCAAAARLGLARDLVACLSKIIVLTARAAPRPRLNSQQEHRP